MISPSIAIGDPELLGDFFSGGSWAPWRAVLKGAYCELLDERELELFRKVAGRDPPSRRVRELWIKAGRRAGKDSIASAIATVAALEDYRPYLRPGERASILCLACDREQAKIIHRYIAAYFHTKPLLRPLVERETEEGLELTNGVEIIVATNSFRAVRGRTIACVVLDEVAYWRDSEAANPDTEIYNALVPGLATLPGAMLIGISTPYRRTGLLYQKWVEHYGKPDDDVLVVGGPSRLFNETLDQRIIDKALERDPEAAAAEWMAEWRSDISDFLDRGLVEAAIDAGIQARPPRACRYFAFVDASGGRGDSFACAIAHGEGKDIVLDTLYERRPPFDPTTVVADVAALLKNYSLAEATGDNYGAEWVVEAFARQGVRYLRSDRDRSKIYLDVLPLFTAGRIRLLDNKRLVHQFVTLERHTSRSGRDSIRHVAGGHDDLANACAGALVVAASQAAPALWRRDDLLVNGAPAPLPRRGSLLYASAAIDGSGLACLYWASDPQQHDVASLTLLDFDVMQPLRFDRVRDRLLELEALISPPATCFFGSAALCYQAGRVGLPTYPLKDGFLSDRPGVSLAVAAELSRGFVKVYEQAYEKAQRQPLPFDFRIDGQPAAATDAALIGIGLALHTDALPKVA